MMRCMTFSIVSRTQWGMLREACGWRSLVVVIGFSSPLESMHTDIFLWRRCIFWILIGVADSAVSQRCSAILLVAKGAYTVALCCVWRWRERGGKLYRMNLDRSELVCGMFALKPPDFALSLRKSGLVCHMLLRTSFKCVENMVPF